MLKKLRDQRHLLLGVLEHSQAVEPQCNVGTGRVDVSVLTVRFVFAVFRNLKYRTWLLVHHSHYCNIFKDRITISVSLLDKI